ncbi:hypothetical protein [Sinimarinibacterium flocculans]|mgnify:CR=1 FL=1|uniref:hypothetical protein n=1 Tax=Sinimarinibacterium flocculans TaxID=985250 RepID=UPI0024927E17|nr:hypothetical protein [Sinimarinibacterium flocculans]
MNDNRENNARQPSQQQAQQPQQTQKPDRNGSSEYGSAQHAQKPGDSNPQKQQGKPAQAPKDNEKLGAQPQKRS